MVVRPNRTSEREHRSREGERLRAVRSANDLDEAVAREVPDPNVAGSVDRDAGERSGERVVAVVADELSGRVDFGHRALEIGIGDPYVAGGVDRQSPRETSGLAAGHRRSLGHRAPTADRGGDRVVASGDPDGARRVDGEAMEAT